MTDLCMTADTAERLDAAHEKYVSALRAYNALRCDKPRRGDRSDYAACVGDARRRVKEAFAEWVMLFEHETGRKPAAVC